MSCVCERCGRPNDDCHFKICVWCHIVYALPYKEQRGLEIRNNKEQEVSNEQSLDKQKMVTDDPQ